MSFLRGHEVQHQHLCQHAYSFVYCNKLRGFALYCAYIVHYLDEMILYLIIILSSVWGCLKHNLLKWT